MHRPRSRRRFLALCAAGGSAVLAGCQSDGRDVETTSRSPSETTAEPSTGLVWRKEIEVVLSRADPPVRTDLLRLQLDLGDGRVMGSFDPAYVDDAVDGASVTVSESLHESLTTEFGDVAYGVSMGPMDDPADYLHVQARRPAFNEFLLGGTATVETFWVEKSDDLRVKYARPTTVPIRSESPDEVEVRQFDLGEIHDGY